MNTTELLRAVTGGKFDSRILSLYGKSELEAQRARYANAITHFLTLYGERENTCLFSVPGRSELSGNHTDHNRGRVIATAVNLDIIAVAAPTENKEIHLASEGYPESTVNLKVFTAPEPARFGTSDALIAGVCQGLCHRGYKAGGFVAYTTSSVPAGAGLSSSAAFENMISTIENHLYNEGEIDAVTIAQISQYAENEFFGKPSGLMDQLACAVGGIIAIDFENKAAPVTEKINFDATASDYRLVIVNTRGSHANLTPDYTAIPAEMKAVAHTLGGDVLREVREEAVLENLPLLRAAHGDRAVLRALHFFSENKRVSAQKKALQKRDLSLFFSLIRESGRSSFCYLQNVFSTQNPREQGVSLALCLAEQFLSPREGAWRVHGGGFAGTVQAFVKTSDLQGFVSLMESAFGKGACLPLSIRGEGAIRL